MKWTRTRPTREGWYFVKFDGWDSHFVWLAEMRDGELVWDDVDDPHPAVATFNTEPDATPIAYAGPIPEPTGDPDV